jgi:hypothetical protein
VKITRELLEKTILSNVELILDRVPNAPLEWDLEE